jgi:hypothetical protein
LSLAWLLLVLVAVAAILAVQVLALSLVMPAAPYVQLLAFCVSGDAGLVILWASEKGL